jgi:chaperonin GroEL
LFPSGGNSKADFQIPGVDFQPDTFAGLSRGINTLVKAISPTLGPNPHLVGIESIPNRGNPPEILDSGGTIAQRVIQIQGRNADVGAMFLRQMLWKLQEKAGDGTATAAVIFQALFQHGLHYLAAGGSSMRLRAYLNEGLRLVLKELDRLTIQLNTGGPAASRRESLTGLAESISRDPELSNYLGEIFDIIGAYGRLEVRAGSGLQFKREYVEGIYWDSGLHSRALLDDISASRSTLENAYVLITNLDLEEPADMVHILQVGLQAGANGLLLVASKVSDRALSVALMKANCEKIKLLAVKTPGSTIVQQEQFLTDIAILTGGRPLQKATLDTFQSLKPADLGRARRVSAEMENFSIVGGKGDPRQFRSHIRQLQSAYHMADDPARRQDFQTRIGQLMGGAATLFTGGITQTECENRRILAEHVATVMRNAILEGVVPGGGIALMDIRPCLEKKRKHARDEDERAAYTLLLKAMEAPFRTLLANSGYDTGQTMAFIQRARSGAGIDLKTGKVVNMVEAGIVDPASVLKEAVRGAIGSAGLLLSTDTIVHRKNPPEEMLT